MSLHVDSHVARARAATSRPPRHARIGTAAPPPSSPQSRALPRGLRRTLAAMSLAALLAAPLLSYTAPAEARVVQAALVEAQGEVTAVDAASRTLSVRRADGQVVPLQVGPKVRNFDRIKAGDVVRLQYYESVDIAVRPKGSGAPEVVSATASQQAPAGQMPAGAEGRATTLTAVVWHISQKTDSVILQGPDGARQTFVLRDPAARERLRTLKEGDLVDFTVTRAVAGSVIAPAKTGRR